VKPVRQSQLYNTLLEVLGHGPETAEAAAPVEPVPLVANLGLRVLLAEDNEINQRVARRMLEKWGCYVVVVSDGFEAVMTSKSDTFDVLVVDCHMPRMDGYEATAEIRRREASTGKHVPIVAMTANALDGDRERCLAAGMDDYVRKPVKPQELWAALGRWTAQPGDSDQGYAVGPDQHRPLDLAQLLEASGQDLELAQELKVEFVRVAREALAAIREAIDAADTQGVAFAAHSLKGASWSLGAAPLGRVLAALEAHGESGSLDACEGLLFQAQGEFQRLKRVLEQPFESQAAA
jgi:CheY-like chemotaxis protein/HPt (histidine-containing phosphotransfer) domain-containing protein